MPWRETTKMSQKLEFITRLQHYDGNFSRRMATIGKPCQAAFSVGFVPCVEG